MERPQPGEVWQHFKGHEYEIVGVGRDSETLEERVVYRTLEATKEYPNGTIWVCPLEMFVETVEREGKRVPRFQKIA